MRQKSNSINSCLFMNVSHSAGTESISCCAEQAESKSQNTQTRTRASSSVKTESNSVFQQLNKLHAFVIAHWLKRAHRRHLTPRHRRIWIFVCLFPWEISAHRSAMEIKCEQGTKRRSCESYTWIFKANKQRSNEKWHKKRDKNHLRFIREAPFMSFNERNLKSTNNTLASFARRQNPIITSHYSAAQRRYFIFFN